MRNSDFRIAVMPGDGIGVEVMEAALAVLEALTARAGGFHLAYERIPGGALHYRETGTALSGEGLEAASQADAILFGAMGWPDIRHPDGREIAPQLDLRQGLGLYAGVRPIRALPNTPSVLADSRAAAIDLVIIRESTEGLFAERNQGRVEADKVARDALVITRATSERLFDFAFRLAEGRRSRGKPGRLACVDKANVLVSMAFFRKIFDEQAKRFPHIRASHHYVDAAALDLVRKPWSFDVLVTENMYGDILSDLAAGLVGGMGVAPSADVGDNHALFQPAHGSAPDIAGTGKANPTAMILSAAMMLDWLGARHRVPACSEASLLLEHAVDAAYAERLRPPEFGGSDGTGAVARAVIEQLGRAKPTGNG